MPSSTLHSSNPPHARRTRSAVMPASHRLAILLALVLSLPLLYSGVRLLLAGIASYQADAFLSDWQSKGNEPSPRAWQVAHDAAQRAIALYPVANGEYLQRLGLIQQWQQFRLPFGSAEASESRRAALHSLRAAGQARPTWPEHWTALAYAKLYLLEFDSEFHHALERAHALGPWRIEVNRRLAEIGLIAWPQLSSEQRRQILESARRTVAYSGKEANALMVIAAHTGMTAPLCASLSDELKASRRLCL